MAAATLVEHASFPSSFDAQIHGRTPSDLASYDPSLPPIHPARWCGLDRLSSRPQPQPQTYSSSSNVLGGSAIGGALSKPNPDPAKLGNKPFAKHLRRRSQDQLTLDSTPYESTTPMDSTDSEAQPAKTRHRRSLSKETYFKNIQKRLRDKDGGNSTIDLSLTMEENEKRSGLAISAQSPESIKDIDSRLKRDHRHSRTESANSVPASDVNLTGPTMGFMQPVKLESRPHAPITNRHSFTEMEWKLCPDAVDTKSVGLGIAPRLEPRQRAATFDAAGLPGPSQSTTDTPSMGSHTWDAATSAPVNQSSRPKMKGKLSNGSSVKLAGNASQSTLSSGRRCRPRRSTAQSHDSLALVSPLSRSSADGTFGFKRGFSAGSKDAPAISEVDRMAAVDAAREQYKQKQVAKMRKYDEQERRAKEKHERKVSDQDEKRRRRQSNTSSTKIRSRGKDCATDNAPRRKGSARHLRPRRRETSADSVKFEHTLRESKTAASKSSGFFSWCKSHILHTR